MKKTLNSLVHILPMLVFAFSATGCNAVMPDRIIGSNPEQEYGDNNYMQWARETLAAIDRDLRIDGTDSYYENQDRTQVSFIWGNIFLQYTYAKAPGCVPTNGKALAPVLLPEPGTPLSPDYKGIAATARCP